MISIPTELEDQLETILDGESAPRGSCPAARRVRPMTTAKEMRDSTREELIQAIKDRAAVEGWGSIDTKWMEHEALVRGAVVAKLQNQRPTVAQRVNSARARLMRHRAPLVCLHRLRPTRRV